MSEIRASTIAIHAEDESGNPLLVYRDANGVLRPVTKVERNWGYVVSGHLKSYENVLVIEVERG